jgi:hypothetical protein
VENIRIGHYPKWILARVICLPAILMPYKTRIFYINILSGAFHLPFELFGSIARLILSKLEIESISQPESPKKIPNNKRATSTFRKKQGAVAVLYSGGTDSTCTAALMAQKFSEVHLLTFYEHATRNSPAPRRNVQLLKNHFVDTVFITRVISVDRLVKHLWYENYLKRLLKHRFLILSTCGFSSLSWHVRTLIYCLENNISHVADGLTRELMHFPGHMDETVEQLRQFYKEFGITYENPVRDWEVPPDQQFIDKVIVNHHGGEFFLGDRDTSRRKTTGQYLFQLGIFPSPNVKGSKLDFSMQHDCYPFTLYNIMAFWGHLSVEPYPLFCIKMSELMENKINYAKNLVREYQTSKETSRVSDLISE